MNNDRATPVMKNDGTKTARIESIASNRGTIVSRPAFSTAARLVRRREMGVDVLDRHGRLVDQDADRQRQPAECHDVDRLAGQPQTDHRPSSAKGIVTMTIRALRRSRRKSKTMRPVRSAPRAPSNRPRSAFVTYFD